MKGEEVAQHHKIRGSEKMPTGTHGVVLAMKMQDDVHDDDEIFANRAMKPCSSFALGVLVEIL